MSGKQGGATQPAGDVFVQPVTAEELEAAEAQFPFMRFDGPTGQWVARMLSSGVKPVDIMTALERGRVPGTQKEGS